MSPIRKKDVERFILSDDYKPMVLKELYKKFRAKTREERRKVREVVKKLEKEGRIFRDSRGRYRKLGEDLKVGTIEFTRSGYVAFVITDEFEEIAVPVEDTKYAMHKDRVVVEIAGTWRGLPRGRVVKVLERGLTRVVGVFDHKGTFGFVVPDDPKIAYDFYVAPENIDGAKPNQKVIAEILKYPSPGKNPEAKVVKVLGDLDDPSIDLPSVIVKHDLPEPGEFPEEVIREANSIPAKVRKKTLSEEKI